MIYFHATIKTKNSDCWLCIFKNLSASELKKKLVIPYKLGKSIYYDGKILSPSDITQVKITKTEKSHEEELEIVQEESYENIQKSNRTSHGVIFISAGYGYNDYEINECGEDVTSAYISGGPGIGTLFTKIAEFIKHPLVVSVVSGAGVWFLSQWLK